MKDKAIIYLMVMLVAAGCSKEDPAAEQQGTQLAEQQGEPLSFDVAEVVEAQTRSGAAGTIDYSVLSKSGYAFGVVAGAPLNWSNQQVKYVDDAGTTNPSTAFFYPSKWRYWTSDSDIKYWNEHINGDAVDFYAYAPYVASPSGTEGITGITGTNVTYTINTTIGQGVDLLWGVNGKTGLPWKNATYTATGDGKQPTGGPVLFTFRHALSAIGFRAQVMINQKNITTNFTDSSAISGVLWTGQTGGGNYKVTIKKIELTGNFHPGGTLSLDNGTKNEPNWTSKTTATNQTLTVENSQIVASMKHPHANASTESDTEGKDDTDNETSNDSDAKIIMTDDDVTGVSQSVQQQVVVNDTNGKESCFFVIPSDASDYTLKLYWCVSAKLPNEQTYIAEDHENTINISSLELKAGTKYLLTFVIGLKLIGLTVDATDWVVGEDNANITIEHGTSASESLVKKR